MESTNLNTTIEWMEKTFINEYRTDVEETVYVTANQHSESVSDLPFLAFEEVYDYGWDDDVGTVPADVVTDVAIEAGREYEERDRIIVHYMQPHFPSIPRPLGHGSKHDNVWKGLMIGRRSKEELWESYIANLRYVLDEVADLLENVDADRVVITADHGNVMGEWGAYEHPVGVRLDCVKIVPWYVTDATDGRTRHPSVDRTAETDNSVDGRLHLLGYL